MEDIKMTRYKITLTYEVEDPEFEVEIEKHGEKTLKDVEHNFAKGFASEGNEKVTCKIEEINNG
jgi:hypothetical protein